MAELNHPQLASLKQHSACDTCRARKVKCSGEPTACVRCLRDGIDCHYSFQSPMGRPRKRRRGSDQSPGEEGDNDSGPSNGDAGEEDEAPDPLACFENARPYDERRPSLQVNPEERRPPTYGDPMLFPSVDFDVSASDFEAMAANLGSLSPDSSSNQSHHTQPAPLTPSDDNLPLLNSLPFADFTDPIEYYNPPTLSSDTVRCTCLHTLFTCFSALSHDPCIFPTSVPVLRTATSTARTVLRCPHCTTAFGPAFQNTMMLGTLLPLIADGYAKVLKWIDREATRGSKRLRMGDVHASHLGPLAGSGPDMPCPQGFEVEVHAAEWRKLARRVVIVDIVGPSDDDARPQLESDSDSLSLMGVTREMERRQNGWHRAKSVHDVPEYIVTDARAGRMPLCTRIVENVKEMISGFGLDERRLKEGSRLL